MAERGYCMRGDMCPYDHGADRIVVDEGPFNNPFPNVSAPIGAQMGPAGANTQLFGMPSGFGKKDLCAVEVKAWPQADLLFLRSL